MKTAINYLEKRVILLKNRITRKVKHIDLMTNRNGDAYFSPEYREAKEYIQFAKNQIKDFEKAIFFLKQTETNLTTKETETDD